MFFCRTLSSFQRLLMIAFALISSGCVAEVSSHEPEVPPAVTGLSEEAIAVGEPLEFQGTDFVSPDDGWVDVIFRGEFYPADGAAAEPVQLTLPLSTTAEGTLVWERFGGYRIPFGAGDRLGEFRGFVFASNRYFTGEASTQPEDTWQPVRLKVLPSVVLLDFRAVGDAWVADCKEPAANVIQWLPYAMRARAVGFEPDAYEFLVSGGLWQNEFDSSGRWIDGHAAQHDSRIVRETEDREHAVVMQFAPVPPGTDGFRMQVEISVDAKSGETYRLTYPFMVRRPVQTFFLTPWLQAERYPAVPVSGCMDGTETSVRVRYREDEVERRQRGAERRLQRGWETRHNVTHNAAYKVQLSRLYSRTASQRVTATDARSASYNLGLTEMFSMQQGRRRAHSINFNESSADTIGWNVEGERLAQSSGQLGASYGDTIGQEIGAEPQLVGVRVGGFDFSNQNHLNRQARTGWQGGSRIGSGVKGSNTYERALGEQFTDSFSTSTDEAYARQQGWNWGFTQSLSESTGFSQTDAWQSSNAYQIARARSESVGAELKTTEREWQRVESRHATIQQTRALIPAHWKAQWYRQTSRWIRSGRVIAYDLCGNGVDAGKVTATDWKWAADLAQSRDGTCPNESNLEAECLIPPCDQAQQ